MRGWSTVLSTLALLATSCSEGPRDDTPAGALSWFLEAMEQSRHDDRALEVAYRLLDPNSRTELASRAEVASQLARREFKPWEMLVQGRSRLILQPTWMEDHIEGDRATVVVGGAHGRSVSIPMQREQDAWRVTLFEPGEVGDMMPPHADDS